VARRPEPQAEPVSKEIELPQQLTLRELADLLRCSPIEMIKQLMNAGVMANINQLIDYDTAAIVAEDMGFTVKEQQADEPEPVVEEEESPAAKVQRRVYSEAEQEMLRSRPPVVTILGHVDHGKTSLLDVIRRTNVQAGEAGGITQHIGAYQVLDKDKAITFLDTPGHEAFTAMRARGASVTDIAVLVVAADDGVQPQTREAINHARAAQVPIIVAVNKIDLPSANVEYALQQLAELGLVPEEWGGDTICVQVSAKQQQNIDTLLDMVLLVAEMADYKANPRREAEGVVIEGRMDRSRGATATLLVQEGTLKAGDALVIGRTYGKIRAMFDYQGKEIKRATPSMPVAVIGLRDVPEAGDTFTVVASEREARELAEERIQASSVADVRPTALSLEDIFAQARIGGVHELNLILKADVQGSIEPIKNSLEKLDIGDIKVRFIHHGVGNVAESDITLAVASKAIVVGFNVGVDTSAARLAEAEGIEVRTYNIIYRLIEDVQRALTGMLEPEYQEVVRGQAIVRQVFSMSKRGNVAGMQVTEGKALRNAMVRVKRGEKVLWQGRVSSLKRYTEDVREVNTGMECGVSLDGFNDYEPDDIFEFYTRELVQQSVA
jgi:translation initiation factor IF-2